MKSIVQQFGFILILLVALLPLGGGTVYAQKDIPDDGAVLEIKILRQTDDYFDIDIGIGAPIRIYRRDIKFMAEKLPFGIGRSFKLKTDAGQDAELILDKESLDKLDNARIETSKEGVVIESLFQGKIIFKDLSPPPEKPLEKLSDDQFRLNERLIEATQAGKTFEVIDLLQRGAKVDAREGQVYNRKPSQQMILDKLNSRGPDRMLQAQQLMFARSDGRTALYYAAGENYIDIARILLESGADPQILIYSKTPLSEAIRHKHIEMIKLLIQYSKSKPTASGRIRPYPLIHMIRYQHLPDDPQDAQRILEIARILIDYGVDVNELGPSGKHILQALCDSPGRLATPELLPFLVKSGADVNFKDVDGQTALAYALNWFGNHVCVELLLNAGADVHVKDRNGKRLIVKILEYFRDYQLGASTDKKNYPQAVLKFIEAGADVTPEELEELNTLMSSTLGQETHSPAKYLSLSMKTTNTIYPLQPLEIKLTLMNTGITRLEHLADLESNQNITIEFRPSGSNEWQPVELTRQRIIKTITRDYPDGYEGIQYMTPGRSLKHKLVLDHDWGQRHIATKKPSYYFTEPGIYAVRTRYHPSRGEEVVSPVNVFEVIAYPDIDEEAYQWLLKQPTPHFIFDPYVYATYDGRQTVEQARELIELFPESTLAGWAKYYLAKAYQLGLWKEKDKRYEKDYDKALELIEEILNSPDPLLGEKVQHFKKRINDHFAYREQERERSLAKEFSKNPPRYCIQFAKTENKPETPWVDATEEEMENFLNFFMYLKEWCAEEINYIKTKDSFTKQPFKYVKSISTGRPAERFTMIKSTVNQGIVYFSQIHSGLSALDTNSNELLWKFSGQLADHEEINNLIIMDDTIFFKHGSDSLLAVNSRDGKLLWKTTVGSWNQGHNQRAFYGTIAAAGEHVYVPVDTIDTVRKGFLLFTTYGMPVPQNIKTDPYLLALKAKTGKVHWEFKTKDAITSNPLIVNDLVYVATESGHLFAIKTKNGKKKWQNTIEKKIYALVKHGHKIIGISKNAIYAVDINTGNTLWRYEAPFVVSEESTNQLGYPKDRKIEFTTFPIVSGNGIYIADIQKGILLALNANSGGLLWRFDLEKHLLYREKRFSPLTLYKNSILIGQSGGTWKHIGGINQRIPSTLHAIDLKTGQRRWTMNVHLPDYLGIQSQVLSHQDKIYFFSGSNTMHVFEEN